MTLQARAAVAEALGTAALLLAVVGSGIMAERLSAGNAGVALLGNALATGFALYVIVTVLRPVSGAHLNPIVTIASRIAREISTRRTFVYVGVQLGGAILGVWVAHLMFDLPVVQTGTRIRSGLGQWVGEAVASAGLLLTIAGFSRVAAGEVAAAVGAYIAAAYWFTSSTSFANPAVTLARALTDTFTGIRPVDAPGFIASQVVGMLMGLLLARIIWPERERRTNRPPDD